MYSEFPTTQYQVLSSLSQVLLPGNTSYTALSKELGGDLEKEIYEVLAFLRCAPYLEDFRASLAATRKKAGKLPLNPTPDGFHPIINGMDLRSAGYT